MASWTALIAIGWLQAASPTYPTNAIPPPPPPPPPPPVADDPVLRAAVDKAKACFDQTWEASRTLRFSAEARVDALGASGDQAAWRSARETVEAYVESRKAIEACIARFQASTRDLPRSANDLGAIHATVSFMRFNYDNQTAYENLILRKLVKAAPATGDR
ncbi:hypothetical protein [Caulobacter sp. 1776]|uniref:hypothetical protein n=1 Tax=Caulobacter sp. 1776 TaxID=3156420 RepID=UPI003396948A